MNYKILTNGNTTLRQEDIHTAKERIFILLVLRGNKMKPVLLKLYNYCVFYCDYKMKINLDVSVKKC